MNASEADMARLDLENKMLTEQQQQLRSQISMLTSKKEQNRLEANLRQSARGTVTYATYKALCEELLIASTALLDEFPNAADYEEQELLAIASNLMVVRNIFLE